MIDLETLDLRTLQKEAARALATYVDGTNNGLADINKKCHHNSTIFYKEVISNEDSKGIFLLGGIGTPTNHSFPPLVEGNGLSIVT